MIADAIENVKDVATMSIQELRIESRRIAKENGIENLGLAIAGGRREQLETFIATKDAAAFPSVRVAPKAAAAVSSIDSLVADLVDSKLAEAIETALEGRDFGRPQQLIQIGEAPAVAIPDLMAHKRLLPRLMRRVQLGLPVLLVGPAGSGKTTLAEMVAKTLGRRFGFISITAGMSESALLGRLIPDESGVWKYQAAAFVDFYRNGGVFLLDEIDAADSNTLLLINAALANGKLAIPATGEVIEKHPDCVLIAAANTFGTGADRLYCGRNQLDAATLDRFCVSKFFIDYDRDFESEIVSAILPNESQRGEFLNKVWSIRSAAAAVKLRRVVSTRLAIYGAKLLATGETLAEVLDVFFDDWTSEERAKVGA